ncbi:MAG: phosphopantetheine-binding protein, partial [Acidobacteriota bacterium]
GKVDRGGLPRPSGTGSAPAGRAPENETERALAAIWCELLGLEELGVDDEFFALGGHSLMATRVVSRIRGELGAEIPLRLLFERPTVAALAAAIEAAGAEGEDAEEEGEL